MASETPNGIKVAILVTDGFEQVEMTEPRKALDAAGATTELVSPMPKAVAFAKAFFDAGKPVASICHGPWTVIEAGAARGRRLTSWPSLKTDLGNAGAEWVDQDVVVDHGLVTSRDPDDIPAFNAEVIKLFASARRQARRGAGR